MPRSQGSGSDHRVGLLCHRRWPPVRKRTLEPHPLAPYSTLTLSSLLCTGTSPTSSPRSGAPFALNCAARDQWLTRSSCCRAQVLRPGDVQLRRPLRVRRRTRPTKATPVVFFALVTADHGPLPAHRYLTAANYDFSYDRSKNLCARPRTLTRAPPAHASARAVSSGAPSATSRRR